MLRPYRQLLAPPAVRRLVAASLAGRLAHGLEVLPLVLLVERATDSYGAAGLAVAAFSVGIGASAPLRGRLVDRRGARAALPPLGIACAAAFTGLVVAAEAGRAWPLVLLALVAGATSPPLVAAMRVEWQRLLEHRPPDELKLAYAFESASQTALFVVGPLLAAAGIALAGPGPVLLVTAAVQLVGALVSAHRSRAPARPPAEGVSHSPIRLRPLQALLLVMALADTGLAVAELAIIARADDAGRAALGGVLVALFALGSARGALGAGVIRWSRPVELQLAFLLLLTAALYLPLAATSMLVLTGALLLVVGAAEGTHWTTGSLTLDRVCGGAAGAEAYTWLSSANSAGFALGAAIGGLVIEAGGPGTGFLVAGGLTALAGVAALALLRPYRPSSSA